jgi:Secretion system C-terminal sorting domain
MLYAVPTKYGNHVYSPLLNYSDQKLKQFIMKRIFTFLTVLLFLLYDKSFSQSCISLHCAAPHTGVVTDGTLSDQTISIPTSGCFPTETYKQIFWEFFFSATGGDFTQTFTPTVPGDGLDLQWTVLELPGAPANSECPIDLTGASEIRCASNFNNGTPTGPGIDGGGPATTSAGNYYLVAIIVEQGVNNGGLATYSFDIGTPQVGGVNLTSINCPTILLPVKLSSFNANINDCAIDIDWTSTNESDLADYEIQSSNDGTKYQTIATVVATGANASQKYSYQQKNPQQGKLFYRLKMIDIDGHFSYSKIIAMNLDCNKSHAFVYPNPVQDVLNINITSSQDYATSARLFDNSGKMVYSGGMISGTNTINMVPFAKGVYVLKLISTTNTQYIKIIK